jgi:hypothetical protein
MTEQYKYETIQVVPGAIVWEGDLNALGEKGYNLVAVVPLDQFVYDNDGQPKIVSNGTNLIFEKKVIDYPSNEEIEEIEKALKELDKIEKALVLSEKENT